MSNTELDRKMFGYSKEQVHRHLEYLEQNHQDQLEKLRFALENARQEKKRSAEKLEELQAAKEKLVKPDGFMELALIRAKEGTSLLKDKSHKESAEILQSAEEKNRDYEKKLINIKNEMRRTKAYFETALQQMQELLEEKKADSNDLNNSKIKRLVSFNKNSQVEKPNVNTAEDKNDQDVSQEEKLTADGMFLPDIDYKKENGQQDDYKRIFEKVSQILVKGRPSQDDAEVEQSACKEKTDEESIPETKELNSDAGDKGSFWDDEAQADVPDKKESSEDEPLEVKTEEVQKPEHMQSPVGNDSTPYSPAVSAQIRNIRQKYIVGKIAGEDILDSNGQKIVGKKELITDEIVAAVEKEGKLPELIVNMILPGMEA